MSCLCRLGDEKSRPLLVAGTAILLVGAFMALFGAAYSATVTVYSTNPTIGGSSGGMQASDVTSYYLCPVWSNSNIDITPFNIASCMRLTGSSLPSQLAFLSPLGRTDYLPNFIGVVLMLLGVVMVVRGYSRHPKVDSPNQPPST